MDEVDGYFRQHDDFNYFRKLDLTRNILWNLVCLNIEECQQSEGLLPYEGLFAVESIRLEVLVL